MAIGMAPGGDAYDILKETLWKPLFRGEEPDWIVAGIAFVGLLADAGYLGGPAGAAGNFAVAVVKVAFKYTSPGVVKGILKHGGSSFADATKNMITLAAQFPAPPGGHGPQWALQAVQSLLNQFNRLSGSGFGLGATEIGRTVRLLATKAARRFSDDAVEGLAYAITHGREQVADRILTEFNDDVAEAAFAALRHLDLSSSAISDDAVRGVAVATKSMDGSGDLITDIIRSATFSPIRLDDGLRNVNALEDVPGLRQYVTEISHNLAAAPQLHGVIFEGTVAHRVHKGLIPEAGVLQQVADTAIGGPRTIDILCSNWAIQVKHVDDGGAFDTWRLVGFTDGAEERARAYLRDFINQSLAQSPPRTPVWVTNGGITASFDNLILAVEAEFATNGQVVHVLRRTISDVAP